jgi:hypothetical protein
MKLNHNGPNGRRAGALKRLQAQLLEGIKRNVPNPMGGQTNEPLNDKDITRINKEIGILRGRV